MKLIATFIFFIVSQLSFGQQTLCRCDITFNDGLAYTKINNKIFTGLAESRNSKSHLIFSEYYINGYKTNYTEYYNTDVLAIAKETTYYNNSVIKQKETKYSTDKKYLFITHYDNNGKKSLVENYENNNLVYRCEYLEGKKHGKENCLSNTLDSLVNYYKKGKKVSK